MKIGVTQSNDSYRSVQSSLSQISDELEASLNGVDQVVIKINFVTADVELATTPITAVKAYIDHISDYYSGDIVIVEEATGGSTIAGFNKYGYFDLAESRSNVYLLDLTTDNTKSSTINYSGGKISLNISKTLIEAPFLASITRAKTHDCVEVTLSIKNVLVGAINGGYSERVKIHKGYDIHEILAEIAKVVYPNLGVIDGTIGMQGQGPISGDPIQSNWSVTSLDPLSADTMATYLMGFHPEDINYLNLIHEKELGNFFPKNDQIGEDVTHIRSNYARYSR